MVIINFLKHFSYQLPYNFLTTKVQQNIGIPSKKASEVSLYSCSRIRKQINTNLLFFIQIAFV